LSTTVVANIFRAANTRGRFRSRFDYIIEVVDRPSYFFFVQVKGTTLGYTAEENRLRVQVTQDDVDRMVAYPAPTYVVRD